MTEKPLDIKLGLISAAQVWTRFYNAALMRAHVDAGIPTAEVRMGMESLAENAGVLADAMMVEFRRRFEDVTDGGAVQ